MNETITPTATPYIGLPLAVETAAFVTPLVAGALSLLGSVAILCHVLRRKKEHGKVYDRLMMGMSCTDIFYSTAMLLTTIPSPADTPIDLTNARFPGYGTTGTCTAQGFFLYFGQMGTTLYYCMLSIYFVLAVKNHTIGTAISRTSSSNDNNNNSKKKMQLGRVEPWLHAIPITYCFATGLFLAITENFNHATTVCWLAPYPVTCRKDLPTCERGSKSLIYRWIFTGIPVITIFLIISVCMVILILNVRRIEQRMRRYQFGILPENSSASETLERETFRSRRSFSMKTNRTSHGTITSSNHSSNHSSIPTISTTQKTAYQALLYICAYFITFIFGVVFQLVQIITGKTIIPLFFLQLATAPLQGFLNFFVYIRPHFQTAKKNNPELSWWKVLKEALASRGGEEAAGRRRRRSSAAIRV